MVLFLHEFNAWVTINDKSADEYQWECLPKQNLVSCYIASEAGKNFQVHWEDTKRTTETDGWVRIDGYDCGGSVLSTDPDKPNFTCKSALRINSTTSKPFKFSQIKLTGKSLSQHYDDTLADPELSNTDLGQIELLIFRVRIKHTEAPASRAVPEQKMLHERAKKGIQHLTNFSDTLVSSAPKKAIRLEQISKDAVARFRFIYRPLDMLRAKGIAPPLNQFTQQEPPPTAAEIKPEFSPSLISSASSIASGSGSRDGPSLPGWDTTPLPLPSSILDEESIEITLKDEKERFPSTALPTPTPTPTSTPVPVQQCPDSLLKEEEVEERKLLSSTTPRAARDSNFRASTPSTLRSSLSLSLSFPPGQNFSATGSSVLDAIIIDDDDDNVILAESSFDPTPTLRASFDRPRDPCIEGTLSDKKRKRSGSNESESIPARRPAEGSAKRNKLDSNQVIDVDGIGDEEDQATLWEMEMLQARLQTLQAQRAGRKLAQQQAMAEERRSEVNESNSSHDTNTAGTSVVVDDTDVKEEVINMTWL